MRQATGGGYPVKKPIAPITVNHGVNPGWGVHEERPAIPAFGGAAEIGRLAIMFTLWSRVESFLYDEVGIERLISEKEEKKQRTILLESETYLIALLCLLNNDHYSASGLVDAMVGVDASADQRGNARKRILNRTLPVVGDRYGLIDYSERHMGNSMEYSICRSQRLVEFAEQHLIPAIGSIFDINAKANTQASQTEPTRSTVGSRSASNISVRSRKSNADKSARPAAAKSRGAVQKVTSGKTRSTTRGAKK